jgi:putative hydrolase of the HAD superfamily
MITGVVFDLDDTLSDYAGAQLRGLRAVCAELAFEAEEAEAFIASFARMEPALFREYADGRDSVDRYRYRRFAEPLAAFRSASEHDVRALNARFMSITVGEAQLFDDALPVIAALQARGIACAVLTNGHGESQRQKLARCGLMERDLPTFISGEIGFSKPHREAFLTVARALALEPSAMLMVGDSIESDIRGAHAVGMRTVLIDRARRHEAFDGTRVIDLHAVLQLLA